ncbi:predicted protein [Histoplasma capsulatum G186AR]|uniref:Uncharacterized protein n=1 Tax=Ajellomyces capsulatus (strain G186AR / H82 / ATCC MYA-2454 / RMSCC 2432) TaxID=447093 RepID=C0NZS6_AJECG|nr:uncharacterized protein HCBG_08656 [Histoplasma capsulatum G186AR]EEH03016.1 predicted protein [Histoplasma capsulatum G186AR]
MIHHPTQAKEPPIVVKRDGQDEKRTKAPPNTLNLSKLPSQSAIQPASQPTRPLSASSGDIQTEIQTEAPQDEVRRLLLRIFMYRPHVDPTDISKKGGSPIRAIVRCIQLASSAVLVSKRHRACWLGTCRITHVHGK